MKKSFDFAVVGAGIAGVAVASELAQHGSVLLLERENSMAYHTTGRSAAISMESYGNAVIRHLTCASRGFFENPPEEIADAPLCGPRGALIIANELTQGKLRSRYEGISTHVPTVEWVNRSVVFTLAPFLADQWVVGMYEPNAFDLDVHAIHSAFVRQLRYRDGVVLTDAEILSAERSDSVWTMSISNGSSFEAHTIVNAAGAWADQVARNCGAAPVGIKPLLRTVAVIDPEQDVTRCPYIGTVDEQIFMKPDVGRLLVSPCDETPSQPCDAIPDEMGIAIAMDRLISSTKLRPRRVMNRWAGLRVFVPDRSPVIGADPQIDGFVWCAALGGYGIQTSPSVARLCAAIATHQPLPQDLAGIPILDVAP